MSSVIGLAPAQVMSELSTHAKKILTEFKKVKNFESLDSKALTAEAKALRDITDKFRDFICTLGRETSLEQLLEGKEIVIPFVLNLTEILGRSEIQGYDKLKRELSKTTLIFLELMVYQCGQQGRRIYKEDVDRMRSTFAKVKGTLPDTEVETRFYVRCAEASVQKLDVGIGKWKEVAKAHAGDLVKGAITALLTAPAFGANTAAPLISPLIDLSITIYKNLEKGWHRDVWALRWHCAGKRITTKVQLDEVKPLMKHFKGTNRDTYYLSFCISQMFMEIYKNPATTEDLRKTVFDGEEMSLLKLAELYQEEQLGDDSFWKTRYITLSYLAKIAEDRIKGHEGYRKASIRAILLRWINEQAQVKVLAGSLISDLAIGDTEEWAAPLRGLKDLAREQKITIENRTKRWVTERSDLNSQIKHFETEIEKTKKLLPKAPAVSADPKGRQQQGAPNQPAAANPSAIPQAELEALIQRVSAAKVPLEEKALQLQEAEIRAEQAKQSLDLILQDNPDWKRFRVVQ